MESATPDHNPAPAPGLDPGVAHQLPADAYWHLIRTLHLTLPPPPGDSPDDLRKRDHAAIACIAALAPGNPAEAKLAARFVAASEHSDACLRLAQTPETTPEWATKCRAQAIGMMREANSALRLLLRLQDARRKREADNAACNSAAWTEHAAITLMAEALAAQPATPEPAPEPEEKPAPVAEVPLSGVAATRRRQETDPVLVAGADRYAVAYPERAAQIRRTGKMPPGGVVYFDPPEAALASALIAGRTPALLALDREFAKAGA